MERVFAPLEFQLVRPGVRGALRMNVGQEAGFHPGVDEARVRAEISLDLVIFLLVMFVFVDRGDDRGVVELVVSVPVWRNSDVLFIYTR